MDGGSKVMTSHDHQVTTVEDMEITMNMVRKK
jgi:hypothetical protein